jgi:hypothetical protein
MIENLLNGVSQQPDPLRLSSQAEEQINGLSRYSDGGPSKRPGTMHVAKLTSTITGADSAFVHPINLGEGQRYFVIITDGTLRVYDKELGIGTPVLDPDGDSYLTPVPAPPSTFVLDTATGTNGTDIEAHASDSGNTWTAVHKSVSGPGADIQSNKFRQTFANVIEVTYMLNFQLPTDDYTVSAKHDTTAIGGSVARWGLKARGNLTDRQGYFLMVTDNNSATGIVVTIGKMTSAGAVTNLANSGNLVGIGALTEATYALRVTGNFIEGLRDGVVVVSATDGTYPTGSYAGCRFTSPDSTARARMDDFAVTYSTPTDAPRQTYRAVTVDNRTFITNSTVKVERDTTRKAPVQTPQAIIYLEQADYSTTYAVTIDGVSVFHTTPAGTEASQRGAIATDLITSSLAALLKAAFTSFTFDQFGSMIRVRRADLGDFTISATDGLADNGIIVIKSQVQRTTDLPLRCVHDYVLEVVGGPEEATDTYWVQFDSQGSDDYRGVWNECSRPGEGLAFDWATMPHELTYTDEITPEMEAKGLPNQPVITLANPTLAEHGWQGTQDGSSLENQFVFMTNHNSDTFVNLTEANGGPLKLEIRYLANTTKLLQGETMTLTLALNDSATPGAGTFSAIASVAYAPGVYKEEIWVVEIGTNVPAAYDVRLTLTYSGGVTPDDGERGVIVLHPKNNSTGIAGFRYYRYSGRDVTWPTDKVYPKGTAWNIDVGGSDADYTQTEDKTGAEIAAVLEPLVEALTGVSSSIVTNANGTAIRIALDAGGLPTVTATGAFDDETMFWNPDIELGFDGDELAGKILKNLSDGSEGTITSVYAHGITVDEMTGGVENRIRNGDLVVVADSSPRFTFRQVRWEDRSAGDSITNPWPSIRDGYVLDVFYHRGRLGLLSAGNVVLSESNKPENLFRTATTDLLDSDPIDAKPASSGTIQFHSAVEWDSRLLLWTDSAQYELRGEPVLTPSTVALPQISRHASSNLRPLALGSRLFFSRGMERHTRIYEYRRQPNNDRPEAAESTLTVPRYLPGKPVLMAGDSGTDFLAILTDTDQEHLFVHTFHYEREEQFQSSWSRWEFSPGSTLVGMDVVDGTLGMLFVRPTGIYLETLDLDEVD